MKKIQIKFHLLKNGIHIDLHPHKISVGFKDKVIEIITEFIRDKEILANNLYNLERGFEFNVDIGNNIIKIETKNITQKHLERICKKESLKKDLQEYFKPYLTIVNPLNK